MKLCRFELLANPGTIRSGIIYSGKIYETDGVNATAVHEAEAVRPLQPVGQPPSVRVFDTFFDADSDEAEETPFHYYLNPSSIISPSSILPLPSFSSSVDFLPYIAIVVAGSAHDVTAAEADGLILGYTIATLFIARDVEGEEKVAGSAVGRSRDIALALGPALTTPDELDDAIIDDADGHRFKLAVGGRINGIETHKGELASLPFTPGRILSAASESMRLVEGDLILVGPIAMPFEQRLLEPNDEVQVVVERLGTLSTKIGP